MNRLSTERRAQIIRCLVEGNSMLATSRITGASKNTIKKLLIDVGSACAEYQNKTLRNLSCTNLQADEIWSFCYSKKKNVPEKYKSEFGYGDVWTFTAICADTKLVPCWLIGDRDQHTAYIFLKDLYSRLKNRVQLTTDGHKMYFASVDDAFGTDVDFAQLIKIYGQTSDGEKRYSPSNFIEAIPKKIFGNPDPKKISISYVERQNLTMRMSIRRFTRLTNAFSKKVENLGHAVALHFMYYNFCRIHKSLRVTPAMEAGVSDKLWDIKDIVSLAE
jgi:IS1 family transposase